MKKIIVFFIIGLMTKIVSAQYDPKALEILEKMSKRYKAIPAFEVHLTSTLINQSAGIKDEFKGTVTVKGDMYRLELDQQQVYNNGKTVWTYLPKDKEVSIDNFDPKSDDLNPSKIFEMYKKGFKYLLLGEKTEGNVLCHEIDLVPEKKTAQYFKVKMLIAKKDYTVQSWTMFDRGGNQYKYTIVKFVPNPTINDSYFTFDVKKYPNVEVNDLR